MSTLRYFLITTMLYTALTAVLTYPQALHLTDTVHDDGDPLLNAWAIAWVAHQLPIAPAHIFDANIFYPERRALAFSETLLAPSLAVAPLRWIGVGPLLVYNIVFLSGFILSGTGVALLVRSRTGNGAAGFVGGLVFAFLPYRIDHYPHLQLQQTQCLPFALWAFHRLLRSGRLRDGLWFGALMAGQVLSCMYYGLFLIPYMALVCGALLWFARPVTSQHVRAFVAAGAIGLVAVAPVGAAYLGARTVVGERGAEEVARGSATPLNYLGPPEFNLLYGGALKRFAAGERRLFPGFVAFALAAVALCTAFTKKSSAFGHDTTTRAGGGAARKDETAERSGQDTARDIVAYGLGLLIAFDLSLGFNGISYRVLYEYVLPFRALRIPARMGVIVGFSLAVLAGFGIAELMRRGGRRGLWLAGTAAVIMLVEYASKPLDLRQIPTVPPDSYADVITDSGDSPTPALFEFPASPQDDPSYMYYSTFHWQYLVNGYSGFFPPSYLRVLNAIKNFPDQMSFDAIKSHGPRYLLVHGERLFGARYEEVLAALATRKDLTLISRRPAVGSSGHGEIALYRISYAEAR